MQGWVLRAGGCPRDSRGVFLPRFFLRWGRKNRAPGGRQVICLVDIACRKLQVCFLKPGVVEYCVENLPLLCINPSTLYGFDLTNRAARSWSLTHTQGSLFGAQRRKGCSASLQQNPSDAAKAAPAPLSGEPLGACAARGRGASAPGGAASQQPYGRQPRSLPSVVLRVME